MTVEEAEHATPVRSGAKRSVQPTLGSRIASELHAAILRGDFVGGSQLKIMDLAAHYDTSAMPIREALRQLSNLGIVELTPNRGVRVLELSLADMRDTMAVRLLLEPAAVEQAARNLSHVDITHATRALADMESHLLAKEPREARHAHEDFHFAFYRATESAWLIRLIEMVWHNADRYQFAYPLSDADQKMSNREHREILAACIKGDAEGAREIMHQHIARSIARIESLLIQAKSESQTPLGVESTAQSSLSDASVLISEQRDHDVPSTTSVY